MNEKLLTKFGCLLTIYISLCLSFLFVFWIYWRRYRSINICYYHPMSHFQMSYPRKHSTRLHISITLKDNSFFFCNKYKERVMALTTEQYFSYNWIIHALYNETDIPIFESTRHNSNWLHFYMVVTFWLQLFVPNSQMQNSFYER